MTEQKESKMINDIQDAFDTNKGIICTHTPQEIYCCLSAEGLLLLGRFKGEGTTSRSGGQGG